MVTVNFKEIASRHLGPPVNIEAIIRDLGIELDKKADLDAEIAGQLERTAAGYRIAVNKGDHYFRRRFTMAHELGHFMLHGHLIGDGVDDNTAYRSAPGGEYYNDNITPRHETEANMFAARLLMPLSRIPAVARLGTSLSEVAHKFQVSPAAMKIRLEGLGYALEGGRISRVPAADQLV